jgi:phage/plasmid primase-like uncharacterized protein
MTDIISSFRQALHASGLEYDGPIHADGTIHRFSNNGDEERNSWYLLHPDGIPSGAFGCWKRSISQTWCSKSKNEMSREEMSAFSRLCAEARRMADEKQAAMHALAQETAKELFERLPGATGDHPYLRRKGVKAHGDIKVDERGNLVIPLRDEHGDVWSVQTISPDGEKRYMSGGRKRGCMFSIAKAEMGPLIIAEGYATGATLHEATGYSVTCAMDSHGLEAAAVAARTAYPDRRIVIAADCDKWDKDGKLRKDPSGKLLNPGKDAADKAARAAGATVAYHDFKEPNTGSDFNDLAKLASLREVKRMIDRAIPECSKRITIEELMNHVKNEDPTNLLGDRWLCQGGSCLIVGPTHVGKSSLALQMAVFWALGMSFYGIKPARPLRSVFIQAENDTGDIAEMIQGILLGGGLIRDDLAANEEIMRMLDANLFIVRDQTHVGEAFAVFIRELISFYKPDLCWGDPLMSYYGDDINNQQAATKFCRELINPIAERTGVTFIFLHHTGKPMKDAAKTTKGWASGDYAYMGMGSSEFSNWARAIICVVRTAEDEFKCIFAKRGWRAGAKADDGTVTNELLLAHSAEHIHWKQIPQPPEKEEEEEGACAAFAKRLIGENLTATQVVHRASKDMKRGIRTVWKLWGQGQGALGKMFRQDPATKLYTPLNAAMPVARGCKDD